MYNVLITYYVVSSDICEVLYRSTVEEVFLYIFSFFTVVDIGMIDFFTEHGYKFILALGLVVSDNPEVKTVCADRDSILTVLECLKQQRLSPSL